jgi:hypothetical protein
MRSPLRFAPPRQKLGEVDALIVVRVDLPEAELEDVARHAWIEIRQEFAKLLEIDALIPVGVRRVEELFDFFASLGIDDLGHDSTCEGELVERPS